MIPQELNIDVAGTGPRAKPRRAVLKALERLLRAHHAFGEQRTSESPYSVLRSAKDDEVDLIGASFLHCGVPLPEALGAIYRRTLGIGNPVSSLPVLAVPFLRAALPDEGYGCPIVGLKAFEVALGHHQDEALLDRPPFLFLGHAAPLGLTASRNGLWSLENYQGGRTLPRAEDFNLVFETAFVTFVDQVLLLWANDLAGALVKPADLDLTQGARLTRMPLQVREAMATLLAARALNSRIRGEVQPLDNPDLLRTSSRGGGAPSADALGRYLSVVGLPYVDDPQVAGRIGPGALLRLCPVDDNPHDPNAVEVWHDSDFSARVGFVARTEAPHVRALPQGASAWRLRVAGRSDHVIYAALERPPPEHDILSNADDPQQKSRSDECYDLFSQPE